MHCPKGLKSNISIASILAALVVPGARPVAAEGRSSQPDNSAGSTLRGQIECRNCSRPSRLKVRILELQSLHVQQFPVDGSGNFAISSLPDGSYDLQVWDDSGHVYYDQTIAKGHSPLLKIYINRPAYGQTDSNVVSLYHLEYVPAKKSTKEYKTARRLVEKGDYEGALRHYRRSVKINPGNAGAYNDYGVLLMDIGRPEQAEPLFRRALARDSASPLVHANLALSLLKQYRFPEAEKEARRALLLDPDAPGVRMVLAMSLAVQNKSPDEAVTYLKQAADGNPPMLLIAAQIEQNRGRMREARALLKRFLAEPGVSASDQNSVKLYLAKLRAQTGGMANSFMDGHHPAQ